MCEKIDFVIPWVDGNDENWRKDKNFYWNEQSGVKSADANNNARFRDWENLRYWFRGVEKFAPWVNHIYFVTYGHIPEWLNVNHPKLTIVKHEDYIPKQYLPTFSSIPIENNFHRIENLSEHFVYFNDDMFLTNYVEPSDFFVNGLPKEMAVLYPLTNNSKNDTYGHQLFTMTGLINDAFNKKETIKKNFKKWFNLKYKKFLLGNCLLYRYNSVSGLLIPHLPSSLRKSTMETVWDYYYDKLNIVSSHKFRDNTDVNQYIYRYWEIMRGTFEPSNIFDFGSEFFIEDSNNIKLYDAIKYQKYKMICINDSTDLKEFENVKNEVNKCFDSILPDKSKFEK